MNNRLKGKRIFFDGHVLDGSPQGTTSYIQGMATELAINNKVFIACMKKERFERYFFERKNIYWVQLKSSNKYVRLAYEIPKLCREVDYDYAYFQYIAPLIKNTKWIVCVNDLLFIDYPKFFPITYIFSKTLLYYLSAKRADILATCSEYSRQRISHLFKIRKSRICITHPAIVETKYSQTKVVEALSEKSFFLYVSRIEPRKNHAVLLDALVALDNKDVLLVFAGHITLDVKNLMHKIRELNLSNQVLFITPSDDELCWLYKHSKACFYPSWCEGFGIPILEAKLAGGLSFCAANTAMLDLEKYVDGIFNPSDSDQIASLMDGVLKKQVLGVDTKQRILADFSWNQSAKALNQMLEENYD